jgi:CubicO group peptidase (beta-lactamase class C family)
MLSHRSVFRIAACLLWASALAAGQSVNLDIPALEASAKEELDATKTPGAAIGIVKDGRLVYANGFGASNIETGAPVTSATLFRLGSTTKMLTAAAVATLAADGKLAFEDPVGKHIQGLDPAIAALTVNQILSHTSGLKDTAVMNGNTTTRRWEKKSGRGSRTGCSPSRERSFRMRIRATGWRAMWRNRSPGSRTQT